MTRRAPAVLLATLMALAAGVTTSAQTPSAAAPEQLQHLCVSVQGAAPTDGWTPASLVSAIEDGLATILEILPGGSCAPPSPSPSPTLTEPVAPTQEWGPMAVVHDPAVDAFDNRIGPGRLEIGTDCVLFGASGRTLVWRDGQSDWVPSTGRIRFRNPDGTWLVLRDGDRVYLSGYDPGDSGGVPELAPWVVRPNPACPTDRWVVHQVVRAD